MAVEAVVSEAVSGRSCAGTGYFFGFQGLFEAKNDELLRTFRYLAWTFPTNGTANIADGTGNFFAGAGNSHGLSGNYTEGRPQSARARQKSE